METQTRQAKSGPGSAPNDGPQGQDPLVGRVLEGRYRLHRELGAGGIGAVYEAEHLKLGRRVAIKVLHGEHTANAMLRQRFEREAKALAALSHPHIVAVTDYGIAEDMPYLVMELLEGRTLQELLADESPLPAERALAIVEKILGALAFAHGRGLIHRDLKPSNVFLQAVPGKFDHVRVLDFGLAKFLASDERASGPALTKTGAIMGTPAYMAPEQAVGSETDARTDVYSAAVMLYEMLAGGRPFQGNPGELLRHHLVSPVPPIGTRRGDATAAPELDGLFRCAMAKERAERFRDASALLDAVRALPKPPLVPAQSPPQAVHDPAQRTAPAEHVENALPAPNLVRGQSSRAWLGRLIALMAGAAVVTMLLGATGVAWMLLSSDESTPSAEPRHVPTPREAPEPAPVSGEAAPGPVLPPDPWAADVPEPLRSLRGRLEAGRNVSERADALLRRHGARHDDARAFLLLGSIYVQRGWRSDGIAAYERAFEMDPASRGDRRMLDDLVALVGDGATSSKAQRALATIYGREAVPVVERALADAQLDDRDRRRYQRLLELLRAA